MSTKAKSKAKPQTASRVLETVYETAADLERLGFIDKRKMQKLDALCMEPIAPYDSAQIRALREQHNLSQTVMATVLNTSASTVRKWEIGEKHPSGPSLVGGLNCRPRRDCYPVPLPPGVSCGSLQQRLGPLVQVDVVAAGAA